MSNDNKVSVLILVYNNFKYLKQAMISVFEQTIPELEIVICDDCSAEPPIELYDELQLLADKSPNAQIVFHRNEENLGTVRNINTGIAKATGKYIKILAADDIYPDKDVLMRQVECMESSKAKVIISKYSNCDSQLNPVYDMRTTLSNELLSLVCKLNFDESEVLIKRCNLFPIAVQACMFRRCFFDEYGCFDERFRLVEDIEMSRRLRKNIDICYLLDINSVVHRCEIGVSSKRNDKKALSVSRQQYLQDVLLTKQDELAGCHGCLRKVGIHEEIRFIKFMCKKKKTVCTKLSYIDAATYHLILCLLVKCRQFALSKKVAMKNV